MKLVEVLAEGYAIGLDTVEEAFLNIAIHADSYFNLETANNEIDEAMEELINLQNSDEFLSKTTDGGLQFISDKFIDEYFPDAVELAHQYEERMYL